MPDFSSDAILLRKTECRDHDYIISFLTRSRGRVSVIAKNAKKSVRRFSGALDLFSLNHIHCTFPKKKKDALINLSQTDMENGFGNIRCDIYRTAYACLWVEMIHFFLEEEKPQPALYDLLLSALAALNAGAVSRDVIHLLFQIRFMALSGFEPGIECCGVCHASIDGIREEKVVFDFGAGRILCTACAKKQSGSRNLTVSKGTLKQLFWINQNDFQRVDRIRFSSLAVREGQNLLESFIPFHLGREFKSLHFLNRLRAEI